MTQRNYDREEITSIMEYKYKSMKRAFIILLFIIMCMIGIIITIGVNKEIFNNKTTPTTELMLLDSMNKEVYSMYDINKPFTSERLIQLLNDLNIQNKEIVYAQAVLETGHFKSKLFLLNHNLFGMRKAYQRPTTNNDDKKHENVIKGYAFYTTWENSVIDYALWQTGYSRNLSQEQYFEKLQSVYAEDVNYVKMLKQIISDNKHLFTIK